MFTFENKSQNFQGLEELRVANQFTGQFLGSALEYAIIELLPKVQSLFLGENFNPFSSYQGAPSGQARGQDGI